MASDGERRSGLRAPIELKVEYKKLNSFFSDYTRNICKGGTFIATGKPLPVGTEFVFRLVVPRMAEPLTLRGEVRWIKREGEPSPPGIAADHEPGMGIRFLYDSDEQRAYIDVAVERMMIDSLGPSLVAKMMGRDEE